jgi:hypothetical protein
MELMLERGSAIARDFAANKKSALKQLLRMAVLADAIKDDFCFTGFGMRAAMASLVALAPIGRLLGYKADAQNMPAGIRTDPHAHVGVVLSCTALAALIAAGLLTAWCGHRRKA